MRCAASPRWWQTCSVPRSRWSRTHDRRPRTHPRGRDAPPYHGRVRSALPSSEETEEKPLKEACGVFGVYAPGQPVAQLTYFGLFALQHRGPEAAGMAVSDGTEIMVVKEQGLVATVFDDRTLAPLVGHLAIGHTRYSTTGSRPCRNAQPVYRSVGDTAADTNQFALGHNGNLAH